MSKYKAQHQIDARKKIKQYIDDYKLSRGCSVCGYSKCARALEFHHNGDKEFGIANAVKNKYGLKRIKREMDKCIILCSNCHKEHEEDVSLNRVKLT